MPRRGSSRFWKQSKIGLKPEVQEVEGEEDVVGAEALEDEEVAGEEEGQAGQVETALEEEEAAEKLRST